MTFSPADDLPFLFDLIREAARVEIMPRFARLDAGEVKTKAHASDFVTVADEGAEKLIFDEVAKRWPHAVLVGEESVEKKPELIHTVKDAALAVVVDPIDGTFNFATGIPAFAVILAIVEKGKTSLGILYDPIRDDFMWAMPGKGAFLGKTIETGVTQKVMEARPVREMHGCVSWAYMAEPDRSTICARMPQFWGAYTYRCGGQEMRLMASGGCHFIVYSKLTPWDHIAGVLILQEAGAHVAHFDGSAYEAGDLDGGLLFAPDKESWETIRVALFG